MHFEGLAMGVIVFLIIGIFHPVVIKVEYYFGKKVWPVFFVIGWSFVIWSLFTENLFFSIFLGVFGFSCLWSIGELIEWIKANPGMFTYPAPPDFTGSAFVRHVFYYAAGGAENLLGPFNQAKYDAAASKAWKMLNDLEPYLWREGKTYPANPAALTQLFANTEIAIYFNYNPANIATEVTNGVFPETVRTYRMNDGNIGNTNYTIIPYNSPNKAAALVLQNVLLSGEAQLEKAKPEVWGTNPGIEMDRAGAGILAAYNAIEKHPAAIPMDNTDGALPELQSGWIKAIEKGWIENVGTN